MQLSNWLAGTSVLVVLGDPKVLAGAIKQRIDASEREEHIHMHLRVRGSWLASFISHVLGMAVELKLRDKVLWASGGTCGSVVFQVGASTPAAKPTI